MAQADQVAAGFLSLGLERGDRIGMWGPNSYEWLLTQWAAARAGLVLVNAGGRAKRDYTLTRVRLIRLGQHQSGVPAPRAEARAQLGHSARARHLGKVPQPESRGHRERAADASGAARRG